MLIDITQNKDNVAISYINDENKIDIVNVSLKYGYYRYVAVNDFEIDDLKKTNQIIPNTKSFKNNSFIKREETKYFSKHNLNEFINFEIKNEYPEIYEKITKLKIPAPFSVDIETEISEEYGYSTQNKAENRILSISITDENLNTLLFVVKNDKCPDFPESRLLTIKDYINTALTEKYTSKYNFDFKIKVFDTEFDMLNAFLDCINKFFQSIIGWNFLGYDWIYITNRCKILGISLKRASPIGKITKKKYDLIRDTELELPTHRIIGDYMFMFKESLIYNSLESYSLNYCSNLILGLNKISYTGNLKKLYNDNYLKFIAYAIIDTILVMLIHKATNLYMSDFFECYYNKIFYSKLSQKNISEALIYNNLREDNIFYLEDEYNIPEKRNYLGGYVKPPTKKIVNALIGLDFSSLYPNSIITCCISPERKIDYINVIDGKPATVTDSIKWDKYKSNNNYVLAPTGRIYDKHKQGIYIKVEEKLLKERNIFKKYMTDTYLNIIPKIENRIKELINN